MTLKFSAPCIFGLEGICANELKYLGIKDVTAENGRVLFSGDYSTLAKANINSRYAERIQILLSEFNAYSFENLFDCVICKYLGINHNMKYTNENITHRCNRIYWQAFAGSMAW